MDNLIEQLGGYNTTYDYYKSLSNGATACVVDNTIYSKESLGLLLLEYRRQHNIFEVGDIAVNRRGEESRLLKIWKVDVYPTDKRMGIADYDADGLAGWSRFHCLRHATGEEIEAGRRL